jgi:signal peptidase II
MAWSRSKAVRYAIVLGVVVVTDGLDLWSKRWAEENLATDRHLVVIRADGAPGGATVGDVVRARFPSLSDADLAGAVRRLPAPAALSPDDPAFDLESRGVDAPAFFEFDGGEIRGFARRIDRSDALGVERWLMRARPDLGFEEARRVVREHLAGVTLAKWLSGKLPHLDEDEIAATVRSGLFPVPRSGAVAPPTDPAIAGGIYLLAHRQVELVANHLDLSYTENPNGAWGLLSEIDPKVRWGLFCVTSVIAILAIAFLLARPPTASLFPLIALGGILGGALGNLVDRLTLTYVVDFIHMYWGDWHWPRYNVADIGITCGVVVLVLVTGFKKEEKADSRQPAADSRKGRG